MHPENKTKLAGLALAGALAVGFAGTASAQDWSVGDQTTYREVHHHAMHYRYTTPHRYDYTYQREGYYRDGYDGYRDDGPIAAAGAIVGSALGAADTAAAVATGYPYGYGYYGPDSYYAPAYYGGYSPDYGNDWWGPYHNQYQRGYDQYQGGVW